jgi:hypothetical protein
VELTGGADLGGIELACNTDLGNEELTRNTELSDAERAGWGRRDNAADG